MPLLKKEVALPATLINEIKKVQTIYQIGLFAKLRRKNHIPHLQLTLVYVNRRHAEISSENVLCETDYAANYVKKLRSIR